MSDYLAGIRARIGTDLLLTPAAGVAFFDSGGRLLLARHVYDGRWGTVGGGIEPGESPGEAAAREFEEEVGMRVGELELIGAYGGPDFVVHYPNGDRTAYVAVLYGCRSATGTLTLQADELQGVGWFTEDEVAALDLPPDIRAMMPDAFVWWRSKAAQE